MGQDGAVSEGVEEAEHSQGLVLRGSIAGARAVEHSVQGGDLQDMRLGGWEVGRTQGCQGMWAIFILPAVGSQQGRCERGCGGVWSVGQKVTSVAEGAELEPQRPGRGWHWSPEEEEPQGWRRESCGEGCYVSVP